MLIAANTDEAVIEAVRTTSLMKTLAQSAIFGLRLSTNIIIIHTYKLLLYRRREVRESEETSLLIFGSKSDLEFFCSPCVEFV